MDAAEIRAAIDGATAADRVSEPTKCRICDLISLISLMAL